MNIVPTPSGAPRTGATRVKDTSASTPARTRSSVDGSEEPRDRADISSAALELNGGMPPGATQLSATRLRQVLERMADGHYDREDVRTAALRSIARDLGIL